MGAGLKRARAAIKGPTDAQRVVLQEASEWAAKGCPTHHLEGSSRQQMGRRLQESGWGRMNGAGVFTINDAGRAAAKGGA